MTTQLHEIRLRTRRRARPIEVASRTDPRAATWLLAAVSGGWAAFGAESAPAGLGPADAIYRAVFAFAVVSLAARSRRWTWVALAAVAAASTASLVGQLPCLIALGAAAGTLGAARRNRVIGAAIAAVSAPALLAQGAGPLDRLSGGAFDDPFGTSALITLLAVAPVVGSGWRRTSGRRRRTMLLVLRAVVPVVALTTLGSGVVLALTSVSVERGLEDTLAASEVGADGDMSGASSAFRSAADEWTRANSVVSGPWMLPGRLVPVLGQHIRAVQVTTGQASAFSTAAAEVTERLDDDSLIDNGSVNVEALDRLTPAVDVLAATIVRADERLREVDSPWLTPVVSERLRSGIERLGVASPIAEAGADALRLGVPLLGGEDESTILVMFTTPAEVRGGGGFVGSWAELSAIDGRIRLSGQRRSKDLNDALERAGAALHADADYESRYARYSIERHIQDVTISPDFPSVAAVAADLYRQATGVSADAIIRVDPFVIDALLEFTGPMRSGELELRSGAAAEELLVGQYERFDGDDAAREAELAAVVAEVVSVLLDEPPHPIALARSVAPLVEEGRLAVWLAADDGSTVANLGVSGRFPVPDANTDLIAVVHQNAGQNKIDTHLRREVDVRTTLRTGSHEVAHSVRISLHNEAPPTGLPPAVIGSNDQGLEPGSNRMILSVYSPLRLDRAALGGERTAVESQTELGSNVYSVAVTLGPGESETLELELSGNVDLRDGYGVRMPAQPLARPDIVSWRLVRSDGASLEVPAGWTQAGPAVALDELLRSDLEAVVLVD